MYRGSNRSSRLKVIVSSLLSAFFCAATSAFSADAVLTPRIEVSDPVFSFGTVTQGTVVSHIFKVKNVGSADLIIDKTVPSCGCTAALPSEGPIQPGKEGTISVTFDTAGFTGDKIKTVRLFSNDTVSPAPVLTVKGYIENLYTVTPARLDFGNIIQGETSGAKNVTVRVKEKAPYTIKEIKSVSGSLVVSNIEGENVKKSFDVSVNTAGITGEFRDRVLVTLTKTDGTEQLVNVPVVASIKSEVQPSPQTISFGVIAGDKIISKKFRLINNTKKPIQIEKITSDSTAIQGDIQKGKGGQSIEGTITLNPKLVTSDLRSAVRIVLSSPREQEILINVYGIIPPK